MSTPKSKLAVVEWLLAQGWEPDGMTPAETVTFRTQASPVTGTTATFAGRDRWAKGLQRITVGKVTTCVYWRPISGGPTGQKAIPTKYLDLIAKEVARQAELIKSF